MYLRQRRSLICAVLVTSTVFSTACGFHLRGSIVRATDLGSVFLDAERNLSITQDVRDALTDLDFELADNRDEAMILLRLTNEVMSERVLSVTSDGSISELELAHSVDMLIAESEAGETPANLPGQVLNNVEVTREYTFDETNVLGKENEARILREEMKRDLVRQIILRSNAILAPSVSS